MAVKTKKDVVVAVVVLKWAALSKGPGSIHLDVEITYDKRSGQYCITCPLIELTTQGNDEEDAKKMMAEAFELWWESCEERGVLLDVMNLHKVKLENFESSKYRLVSYEIDGDDPEPKVKANRKNTLTTKKHETVEYDYSTTDLGSYYRVLSMVKKLAKQESKYFAYPDGFYKISTSEVDGETIYKINWHYTEFAPYTNEVEEDNVRAEFTAMNIVINDEKVRYED